MRAFSFKLRFAIVLIGIGLLLFSPVAAHGMLIPDVLLNPQLQESETGGAVPGQVFPIKEVAGQSVEVTAAGNLRYTFIQYWYDLSSTYPTAAGTFYHDISATDPVGAEVKYVAVT